MDSVDGSSALVMMRNEEASLLFVLQGLLSQIPTGVRPATSRRLGYGTSTPGT